MNAFNPLEATKRLQAAGITRRHAEAIASEINASNNELVTKTYFKEKLDSALESALAKQTMRNGMVTSGIVAVATTVLGLLISLQ